MQTRYLARFSGRQSGAIGVFHPCAAIVAGPHPVSAHEASESILQAVRLVLYEAYEHIQGLTVTAYNGSLYEAVQTLGIEHDSHESDLYLPATGQVRLLLKAFGIEPFSSQASQFTNQKTGGIWFDVPFMYSPWWEARQR